MNEKGLSIIIPAFNEEDGITDTVKTIKNIFEKCQFNIEVIFVNDGSTDTTLKKLNELSDSNKFFKIINHNKNNGYGASLKTGISASKFDYVAITDADETYPNHKIIDFYHKAVENNLDMIVGARIGANVKIPLIRKPANQNYSFFSAIKNFFTLKFNNDNYWYNYDFIQNFFWRGVWCNFYSNIYRSYSDISHWYVG